MRPAVRRVLSGLAAGLMLIGVPADAQIRPDNQDPRYFRWSTRRVTIRVQPEDFLLGSGTATITVPRAIIGFVRPRRPWHVTVRADPFFELKGLGQGISAKPCNTMAIRWTESAGDFLILSPIEQVVASGEDIRGRQQVAFDIKFAAYLSDIAGEYSIELYFDYN